MEQLDLLAATDVETSLPVPLEKHNDTDNKMDSNSQNPSLSFQFLVDTETDQKEDDSNACEKEKLKKDLLLKADEFFNSGCAKMEHASGSSSNQHDLVSSSPSGEVFLGLDSEQISEYDDNLLKYCVSMGVDDNVQVPLEHINILKDELNALEYRASKQNEDDKPSYSMLDSLDMNSAESIEKVLNLPPFDPQESQIRFIIKRALSLNRISRSKDNVIQMFMPMKFIKEYIDSETFNPMTEFLNTFAKHEPDEFCTFCSCKECIAYREIAIHIMMEQFKASHMIVLLLDALIKAYSPLLRNATAFNGFEKLLENNKDIYWIASGLIYNKKYEHLDLIYDETLTDPIILVLFSSILMVNNPMQLLQILSFHIKCIIKAFAVGICEVPADEKLAYIIDGFDHLCLISEQIATYFFMFEKYFLNRFSLSWVCLCQRLFHQHVYMKFFVAITNSGESLKSDDPLKNRYFDFAKRIICTDMRWNRYIWPKLQEFNLTDIEMKRRKCMLRVHHLFDAVVEDALRLPLEESSDDNLFYDIHSLENRRLAWQNIMAFAKMKWPDGFFNSPNTLVLDLRCEKCGAINEQHENKCKCVTCSIGGDPFLPPSKMKNICLDCLLKQRKMNEESQQHADSSTAHEADDEELKDLLCSFVGSKRSKERTKNLTSSISKMGFLERFFDSDISELGPEDPYHISWATFKHLSQRERYIHGTIDEKYFCKNCNIPSCMLARKLLNNEISPELTAHLVSHFHPLPLLQHELRALLPNIVFYNQRLITMKNESSYHNVVIKAYWTFIVSLYTTYFFEFEPPSPLNLTAFVIEQSDIKLLPEKLTGDPEDTKFLEFLAAIRSFAPPDGGGDPALFLEYLQREDVKQQLDAFLKSQEERRRKILSMIKVSQATMSAEAVMTQPTHSSEPSVSNSAAVTVQPTACNSMPMPDAATISNGESQQKKTNNSKPKKCCLEHAADLGAEHCKDNHAGKKRLKKDCGHARINETRDRLRKKLQNARKHQQQQQIQQQQHHIQQQQEQLEPKQPPQSQLLQQLSQTEIKLNQQSQQQQQQQQPKATQYQTQNGKLANNQHHQTSQSSIVKHTAETAITAALVESELFNDGLRVLNADVENPDSDGSETLLPTTPPPSVDLTTQNTDKLERQEKTTDMGKSNEYCDMIDNNKLKMKKWIDETLTYIEGYAATTTPNAANSNKKLQPQTKNPKKAAKKAKQKLRKEEEKRIGELHEIRAQFQDIYFKEFLEKIELKSLKNSGGTSTGSTGNKRRCDKKKISEIEANIKNLQRAKAKLEGNILELIATVKQTNTEFKFSYLPTKEQQQAKLREIEHAKLPIKVEDSSNSSKQSSTVSLTPPANTAIPLSIPHSNAAGNAFNLINAPISSAKFFPNISFPYEMSFPAGGAVQNSVPLGYANGTALSQKFASPMCYAPPPQQQLTPNVTTNEMANGKSNNAQSTLQCSDPSKRIVTIRRVLNPNLPDSQVTVIAKGSSPNEDKLLYTFINGQLVPTLPTGSPNSDNSSLNEKMKPESTTAPAPPVSKSQLKKERRRQAKLQIAVSVSETETIKQNENLRRKQKIIKSKGNLSENKDQITAQSSDTVKSSQDSTNRMPMKEIVTFDEIEQSIKEKYYNTAKKAKKTKKLAEHSAIESKKSQQQQQQPERPLHDEQTQSKVDKKNVKTASAPTAISAVETVPICKKDKTTRHKLVNHGQFDNNPYKTLHMQDSDSELEVSASSCDEDIVESNESTKFEELLKTKLKINQPKPATTPTTTTNNNSVIQKKIAQQQQKASNSPTIPYENKPSHKANAESVNEQRRTKHTAGKSIQNQTPACKILTQTIAKQKESSNRKSYKRDQIQHAAHGSDRRLNNENTFSAKNIATTKTYQNTTFLHTKSPPTAAALSKRNPLKTNLSNSSISKPAGQHDSKPQQQQTSKRSQRAKKKQEKQQSKHFIDCGAGIPSRMEHFNPNEVNIISQRSYAPQQQVHVDNLSRQFQGLQLKRETAAANLMPSYASVSANKSTLGGTSLSTVSIMDQLNRGVQVENLSLPPGITLTKVDPIKSEQLRQKSESIKRLSQPLQQNNTSVPGGFQHHGSTLLAPSTINYLPTQYAQISANTAISSPIRSVPLDQGNIIMVENISGKTSKTNSEILAKQSTSSSSNANVPLKNKRRRNKGKRTEEHTSNVTKPPNANGIAVSGNEQQPKMITLRNPMFHAGPAAAAAATVLQQPSVLNRHGFAVESGGAAYSTALPMDQPAAIIKNENGMFTIRNPALHQAVTNGLALSGYRHFGGNDNYYTPQEAFAEASKAAQQHQVLLQKARIQATAGPTESFSYFSNNPTNNLSTNMAGPTTVSAATSPTKPSNTISITCSVVDNKNSNNNNNVNINERSRRTAAASPSLDPTSSSSSSSTQRCISAIGSEIKNNRSSNVDLLWSEYGQQENLSRSHENLTSSSTSMLDKNNKSAKACVMLQDKYQQSSYYNGFEVFPPQSGNNISTAHSTPAPTPALGRSSQTPGTTAALTRSSNSLFDATVSEAHIHHHHHAHHSCGDDSPPPTSLLGYSSSYLDDIPNTGVIRYDDASFLKNLIPGQRLNKEVSIHNINESNHGRTASPMSHLVEITPVFGGSNKVNQSQELQSNLQQRFPSAPANYSNAYQKNFSEFDTNLFQNTSNNYLNPNKSDTNEVNIASNIECDQSYKIFNYDFETPKPSVHVPRQKSSTDLNNMYTGPSNFSAPNHRASPFLDDRTMENFVQNLNALQIGNSSTLNASSQQQMNGERGSGRDSAVLGNTSNSNWLVVNEMMNAKKQTNPF